MSEENQCGQCGAPLSPGAPEGLCPACLLKRALETQTAGGGLAADFTPPPPEELARYFPQLEILELLGRGGMGVVYKARQRELDRMVALKILPSATDRDPAFAERFAREARALARLSHPNIVAVYDFGQTGGLFYFVMEYVDGLNLRQLLATARITPEEALAIVPQICEALQTAHDQGIVHRDIKPENILMDKRGRVKIADFGIAKIMGDGEKDMTLTGAGEMVGTPAYMAPEQIEHPRDVDHRADIYSLGVVFYQMLTGELPLGKFAPPSRKVRIDIRLDEVVLRALEKEPELRYQQASEVKTEVETIAGMPPAAGETSTGGTAAPPGQTNATHSAGEVSITPAKLDETRLKLVGSGLVMAIGALLAAYYFYIDLQPAAGIAVGAWGVLFFAAIAVMACMARGSFEKVRGAARVNIVDAIGIMALGIWGALNTPELATPWRAVLVAAFGYGILSGTLKLACIWPFDKGFWALDRREKQPMGYAALYCSWLSGLVPTLFYWLRPWAAPWLSPQGQDLAIWATLYTALCAIILGLGARKSRLGRYAIGIGGANLTVWLLFFVAGELSASGNAAGPYKPIIAPATSGSQAGFEDNAAPAEQLLAEYDWEKLAAAGQIAGGAPVKVDGRSALKIENSSDAPLQVSLLKIEKPRITSMQYFLTGEIKYEDVHGAGYLEMWNYFPPLRPGLPEGQYFSRTLGAAGSPMGQIAGTSSWRTFILPFNRTGSAAPPTRLEFNIFLAGRGVVYIGPLKLTQLAESKTR